MHQIGYISSFLESEGIGFLRSATNPRRLVLFRRAAVADDLADHVSLVGLEVEFEAPVPACRPHPGDRDGDRHGDAAEDHDDDRQIVATVVRPHTVLPRGEPR